MYFVKNQKQWPSLSQLVVMCFFNALTTTKTKKSCDRLTKKGFKLIFNVLMHDWLHVEKNLFMIDASHIKE